MAAHARIALEAALRAKQLDRTLTTALPSWQQPLDAAAVVPTAIPALDRALGGGLPRGQVSEVSGPRSSGRTALLLQACAAATRQGDVAALIDTFDRLDVASADAAGIDFDRLLWVRGQAISRTDGATDLRDRTVERAVKALNLVLQAGGFALVVLDLADVPPAAIRQLPMTTWLRLQRAIEGTDTACLLVVPEPIGRSAGGLTLTLTARTRWAGVSDRSRRVAGLDLAVRVVSPRRRVDGEVAVVVTMADADMWNGDAAAVAAVTR